MKYTTTNELEHFSFAESYIADIQKRNGWFQLTLDNVTIMPENSCNRDIRQMRANGLELRLQDGAVESLIREGYKVYNADGKLTDEYPDTTVEADRYNDVLKSFAEGCIYSLTRQDNSYEFVIDSVDERTYVLRVAAVSDVEAWDRFLNK